MIKLSAKDDEEASAIKDWVFAIMGITKWEDTCVEDSKKILECISTQ